MALILAATWLLWIQLLRLARITRTDPDSWTREHVMLAVFRSPSLLARSVGCFLTVVTTIVVASGLARVASLPSGYGNAQSNSAADLATRPRVILRELREGADRDLRWYIAMYIILVIFTFVVASPLRRRDEHARVWQLWERGARRAIVAGGGLRGT